MILPQEILEKIKYYKLDIDHKGQKDIFILYYKSFWKLPKVITFQRLLVRDEDNPERLVYISSNSSLEFLNQLKIYFDENNELIKITKEEFINVINYTLTKTKTLFKSYDEFFDFLRSEYIEEVKDTIQTSIQDNQKIIQFPNKTPPK